LKNEMFNNNIHKQTIKWKKSEKGRIQSSKITANGAAQRFEGECADFK
jgi:hypothetical protein